MRMFSTLRYRESHLLQLGREKWFVEGESVKDRRMKLVLFVHEAYGAPDIMDTKAQRNGILSLIDRLAALEEKFEESSDAAADLRLFTARFWGRFSDKPPETGVDSDNSFLFLRANDATVNDVFRYINENRSDIGVALDEFIGSKVERRWVQHARLPMSIAGGLVVGGILLNWINSLGGNLIEAPREIVASDARHFSFGWTYGSGLSFDPQRGAVSLEERRKALREITKAGDVAYADYDLHGRQLAIEVPAFVSTHARALEDASSKGDRMMVHLLLYDLVMLDADAREFTNSPWGASVHQRIALLLDRYDPRQLVRSSIYSGKFLELIQENSGQAPDWIDSALQK